METLTQSRQLYGFISIFKYKINYILMEMGELLRTYCVQCMCGSCMEVAQTTEHSYTTERRRRTDLLDTGCVHGQVLHCDERVIGRLSRRDTLLWVKGQQAGQQLHKLHYVQLVFDAHIVNMVTVWSICYTLHRCENELSCFFWFDIRL